MTRRTALRVGAVALAAATVLAESLLRLGLSTGKHGEYATPPTKAMSGLLAGFERQPAAGATVGAGA